jgi:PAS domain S-box-containing protein
MVLDRAIQPIGPDQSRLEAEVCKGVPGAWQSEGRLRLKNGGVRQVLYQACAWRDAQGEVQGALQIVRDMVRPIRPKAGLARQQEMFQGLFDKAAYGAALAEGGRVLLANQVMAKIFGYDSPIQMQGIELKQFIHPDYHSKSDNSFQRMDQGAYQPRVVEQPCLRKDGTIFWLEAYTAVVNWEGRPAMLITSRDITVQKQREQAMAEEAKTLRNQNVVLRTTLGERYRFAGIIGKSEAMREVYDRIMMAASSDAGVIICGESGTGKDLVAKAIHANSMRTRGKLVAVNCGAIPANLLESEFFGHKKGAFTGADKDKQGYLDLAHRGTLFLDEVGELSLDLQVKLLRVLESGEYIPVGGGMARRADVRVLAATNRNLSELVAGGAMREDFYYRVQVIPINLPPLRERREDIPLLVQHFLEEMDMGRLADNLPSEVREALNHYHWPGNVRELMNVLQRYVTLGRLDMPRPVTPPGRSPVRLEETPQAGEWNLGKAVAEFERDHIRQALEQTHWRRGEAAGLLGISRKTLFRKIRALGLDE